MSEPLSVTLGIDPRFAVAGFLGGILSLGFIQNLSRPVAFTSVGCGICAAIYFNPVVVEKLAITSVAYQGGSAFVMGLCGMSICAGVMNGVKARIAAWGAKATFPSQGDGGTK